MRVLSENQKDILRKIRGGKQLIEIARERGAKDGAVRMMVLRARESLGARTTEEAISIAEELRMI